MTVVSDVTFGEMIALGRLGLPSAAISEFVKVNERVCRYWLRKGVPPSKTKRQPRAKASETRAARMKAVVNLASKKLIVSRTAFTPKRRKEKTRLATLRPFGSPSRIARELRRSHGISVSESTVRRDLLLSGMKAKRRRKVSFISDFGKSYRVLFCHWVIDTKPLIAFSDEKEFDCDEDCNVYEWVNAGERPSGARGSRDGAKLGVWGCIAPDGTVVIRTYTKENLDREKYRRILGTALPELRKITTTCVFMQDGARAHCGALEWLKRHKVRVLDADWPALSSDLNPIEQYWSILARRVKEQAPYGVEELERFVLEESKKIDAATVRNLVGSFWNRCHRVVVGEGEFIKP